MKTYLVGGAVRDGLLGREVRERDWVVVGATPAAMRARGFRRVGRDFPVFLHPRSGEEYALARTERKTGPGHADFVCDSDPSVTLEADLGRRDLTINAMAKAGERIIDPYGGQRDLAARVLRHVSPAFAEDPLRVFRVARFAALLPAFRVADETLALMRSMRADLPALSGERVWRELARAVAGPAPAHFFKVVEALAGAHWFHRLDVPATAALFRARTFRTPAAALAAIGWANDAAATAATFERLKAPRIAARAAVAVAEHGATLTKPAPDDALLGALAGIGAFRQGELASRVLAAIEDCADAPLQSLVKLARTLRQLRVDAPPGRAYGVALRAARLAHISEWRRQRSGGATP